MRFSNLAKGLIPKFIITYILAIFIPSFFIANFLYNDTMEQARSELVNSRKDSLLANKNYMETQFSSIEQKALLFHNASGLYELLEPTFSNTKEVVYTYWKDFVTLTKVGEYNDPLIDTLHLYSGNPVACEVLPMFVPLEELYQKNISPEFAQNADQMLFKQFWQMSAEDGEVQFTFYSGLMSADASRLLGAVSISCKEELLQQFFLASSENTATYLYWDGKLVHSINPSSDTYWKQKEAEWPESMGANSVSIDTSRHVLQSRISLSEQNIDIIQLEFLPSDTLLGGDPFSTIWFWWILISILSSLLVFVFIFKPMRNVSRLAKHMRYTQAPALLPYSGKVTRDEVGDLISAYNDLVNRTLEMTETLHQNEILLKNAQIERLQAQLNPHFFYGTLESIRMIAEAHGETLISEIAYAFGNLMRYSLSQEYFVTIEKEMDIVKQYLDIQQKRLGNRFSVEWKLDVSHLDWDCPKFVLFSMIENVVVHDVGRTRKHVHILIEIRQDGDDLYISVTNDGPGISPERLAFLQDLKVHPEKRKTMSSRNNGRSIFNIHDRLQLYYGNDYEFSIDSEENVKTVCSVKVHIKPNHAGDILKMQKGDTP